MTGASIAATSPKPTEPPRIKRPPNAFFLYRKHLCKSVSNIDGTAISKVASVRWAAETPQVRLHFNGLAEEMRRVHFERYPDFKWRKDRVQKEVSGKAQFQALSLAASATLQSMAQSTQGLNIQKQRAEHQAVTLVHHAEDSQVAKKQYLAMMNSTYSKIHSTKFSVAKYIVSPPQSQTSVSTSPQSHSSPILRHASPRHSSPILRHASPRHSSSVLHHASPRHASPIHHTSHRHPSPTFHHSSPHHSINASQTLPYPHPSRRGSYPSMKDYQMNRRASSQSNKSNDSHDSSYSSINTLAPIYKSPIMRLMVPNNSRQASPVSSEHSQDSNDTVNSKRSHRDSIIYEEELINHEHQITEKRRKTMQLSNLVD